MEYKTFFKEENYKKAYELIKSKPGNMTPGVDGQTLDRISNNYFQSIINAMKDRTFKFKPSKRIYIPKANGKLRPIGIPCPKDKVIQKVFLRELEPILEKVFSDCSHGFRPGRSCLTAIKQIRVQATGAKWMIEGDIKGYFDNINTNKLGLLLAKYVDVETLNLYRKLVKAGYIDTNHNNKSPIQAGKTITKSVKGEIIGVPQGGILSPILSNLYLHELDKFMEELMKNNSYVGKKNPEYVKYDKAIYYIRKQLKIYTGTNNSIEEVKRIEDYKRNLNLKLKLRSKEDCIIKEGTGCSIYYVRYADDFIVSVNGKYKDAEIIKQKINDFLKGLDIELNMEKTHITDIYKKKVYFLGYEIKGLSPKMTFTGRTKKNHRISWGGIKVLAPQNKLQNKLRNIGFCDQENSFKQARGISKWIHLSHKDILTRYNAIINGLMNYYKLCDNPRVIDGILYILKMSAASTLKRKLNISIGQVFKRFGSNLTFKDTVNKKQYSLNIPKTYKNYKSKLGTPNIPLENNLFSPLAWTVRTTSILDLPCQLCGATENIEMHHVKHIRKGKISGFTKYMSALNRKQIPVCPTCHDKIHQGKYDGKSL